MAGLVPRFTRGIRSLKKELAEVGGADSSEIKAAARVLANSIRKVLSVRGALIVGPSRLAPGRHTPGKVRGLPSTPGEPPHRISGRLAKSVGTEVVGGVMRVGESYFTARLLEEGVDATKALTSGQVRRRKGGIARARIRIAARPFMKKALEAALPKMGDTFAVTLSKKIQGGSSLVE